MFAATWLSYVGFYFCRKPFSATKSAIGAEAHWDATVLGNIGAAYLIAYAAGQFLASYMGTKLGPRRNVLIGMAVSIAVTVAMPFSLDQNVMMGLMILLGLSQATGWSGNVGSMAGWFHRHERGRVMGAWSTNFNIGSLTSGWVIAWILGMATPAPWRRCYFAGAAFLTAVWILFYAFQRNRPEDVGLAPVDDPETAVDESKEPDPPPQGFMGLSGSQWTNLMLVAGFYFFVKFIRYAIWSWAPFFLHEHYFKPQGTANWLATSFDLLGLPGVYATGWLSDKYFASRRAGIAALMMLGVTAATTLLFIFYDANVWIFTLLLAAIGFTCYGPDALLTGAGAMDIGGRRGATFAAAVISGFGSMGSIVQELVIAHLYDPKKSLEVIFGLLLGCAALGAAFCGLLVYRNKRGGNGI
ncbi:MAG: MFS transporter [Deltaproteobacteria bacterium]|nr:MFS transporter [Deltaproteobacteria bacterium]